MSEYAYRVRKIYAPTKPTQNLEREIAQLKESLRKKVNELHRIQDDKMAEMCSSIDDLHTGELLLNTFNNVTYVYSDSKVFRIGGGITDENQSKSR